MTRPVGFGSAAAFDRAQAVVEGVDIIASAMERKWGVGRLRLLADDLLRERFDRQRRKFDDAVFGIDMAALETQAGGLKRAWQALEAAAVASGHQPNPPTALEAEADGIVIVICADNADASLIAAQGRKVVVYTIQEAARLLAANTLINEIKQAFPGAEVASARSTAKPINWSEGDDLPALVG